jgi:hypothetical protein
MKSSLKRIVKILIFFPELILYLYYTYKYSKIDYFQYEVLSKTSIRFPHISRVRVNIVYGNYFAIKKLSNDFSFYKDYSEHGVIFCDYIKNMYSCRNIYTYSVRRKEILQASKQELNVIAVGPYIIGANFFHSRKIRDSLKKKYGKILLVFPTHSLKKVKNQYDVQPFIDEILKIKHYFQSVFICLHWVDILNNWHHDFLIHNFVIVTAGSPDDIKFLSRLKDLIELSDMTMSNSIGTHIGYSICMDKPHYFFYQPTNCLLDNKLTNSQKDYEYLENKEKQKLSSIFSDLFGNFSWKISQDQIKLCEKYWGKWG